MPADAEGGSRGALGAAYRTRALRGRPAESRQGDKGQDYTSAPGKGDPMLRGTAREAAAEFLGTAVLLAFGSAVVAQVVLSGQTHGGYLSINIAWGLAVTMGVYVAGGVSGAHLNPAVTLAVAVHRDFAWSKVLPYMAAQIAGAFTGAAVTFLTSPAPFDPFDGGTRQVTGAKATAGIFATYPQDFLRTFPDGLIDQVVGTALLIALIFAPTDQKHPAPEGRIAPIHFGLLVVLIGMTRSPKWMGTIRPSGARFFWSVSAKMSAI